MVAVLFARCDSIYKQLGCDVYDINRNALTHTGLEPIIAHPPCRAWGKLKGMAKPLPGEKELAIFSIIQIRKNGGVLEHPRASGLWKRMLLPTGQNVDRFGGYTIRVNQSWFGHRAEKDTLLYIVGVCKKDLPPIPITYDCPTHIIGHLSRKRRKGWSGRPSVSKRENEATPRALAEWLIQVAQKAKANHTCTHTR